jgi:hypothetical protein
MLRKLKEESGYDLKEIRVTRELKRLIAEAGFYRVVTSTIVTPSITFVATMDWTKIMHDFASADFTGIVHNLGTGNKSYAQAIIWREMLIKVPGQILFKYVFDRVPYGYKLVRSSAFKGLEKDEEIAERVPARVIESLKRKQGIGKNEDVVVIATSSRAWAESTFYRFYASAIETPLTAFWATGHWKYAAAIMAAEVLPKIVTYRLIHKVWDYTTWGLRVSCKEMGSNIISLNLTANAD